MLVRAAAGVALWLAFRLGRELGGSRWAGAAAVAGVALAGGFALEAVAGERGAARDRGRAGGGRRAGAPGGCARRWRCGAACALLRVEAWPFLLAAGVVAWRRDPGARPLLAALALLVPAAWFVPEWLGSGDVLRSGARARVPNPGQPALADVPALASLWAAAKLLLIPLWIGVVVALRDRRARLARGGRRRVGRCSSRRWPQAGFSGEPRYALPGVALLAIAGAAGLARGGAAARPSSPRLVAVAAVPRGRVELRDVRDAQAHQWALARDLGDAVAAAGGREAVLACGRPYVGPLPRAADGLRARRDQAHGRARSRAPRRPASCSARGSPPRPRPLPRPARRSARPCAWGSGRCCAAARRIRVP